MAKTRSKHQQGLYTAYKNEMRWAKNRRAKLERALKRNPENLQIVEALKNIKYRRKTPGTSLLSTKEKSLRGLVTGLANKRKGMERAGIKQDKINVKRMFSLGVRAHTAGQSLWSN